MSLIAKTRTDAIAYKSSGSSSGVVALAEATPTEIYLHPGQMYAGSEPAQISMILGSCAGVCLYDQRHAIGGATHYMLPKWEGAGKPSARYGDVAIHALVRDFEQRGCEPYELQAMVFGGASILNAFRAEEGPGIGARNVETAIEVLKAYGMFIVTKSVGGEHGRKIKMRSDMGTVTVKLIGNL